MLVDNLWDKFRLNFNFVLSSCDRVIGYLFVSINFCLFEIYGLDYVESIYIYKYLNIGL